MTKSLKLILFIFVTQVFFQACKTQVDGIKLDSNTEPSQSDDKTPPDNVDFTWSPTGSTISNTVTITATAKDNVAVTKVVFYLVDGTDNVWIGNDTVGPDFSLQWTPKAKFNGLKKLKVKALDAAGNATFSAEKVVTINAAYTIKARQGATSINSPLTYTHYTVVPSGGNSSTAHYDCVQFSAGVVSPTTDSDFSPPPNNTALQINFTNSQIYTNSTCTSIPTAIGTNTNYITIPANNSAGVIFYLRMLPGTTTITGTLATDPSKYFTINSTTPYSYPTKISLGKNFGCALIANNQNSYKSVKCWGSNSFGQLGNGVTIDGGVSNTNQKYPVDVVGLSTNVIDIAVGQDHACALQSDYAVKCWGLSSNGRLGNGQDTTTGISTPVTVSGLSAGSSARKIFAGPSYTCVLLVNNTQLQCWGYNGAGTTTAGSGGWIGTTPNTTPASTVDTNDKLVPTIITGTATIPNGSTISNVALGNTHICITINNADLAYNNKLYCWGKNNYGQLGLGTTGTSSNGALFYPFAQPNSVLTSNVTKISTTLDHTCVVQNSAVKCWGNSSYAQAGTVSGTVASSQPTPQLISNLSNITDISTGNRFSCAINTSGNMYCWGYNWNGSVAILGASTAPNFSTNALSYEIIPLQVFVAPNSPPATLLTSGDQHSCAYYNNATGVKCWGYNAYGQLSNGTTSSTSLANPVTQAFGL